MRRPADDIRAGPAAHAVARWWSGGETAGFLATLHDSPGCGVLLPTDRHARVLAEVVAEVPELPGNVLHDTPTAVLMREHGIRRICTRDTDFHRFPFVEPIDRLGAEP